MASAGLLIINSYLRVHFGAIKESTHARWSTHACATQNRNEAKMPALSNFPHL